MDVLTDEEWEAYKLEFKKSYADEAEDAMRREIVAKYKAFIDEHNKRYEAGEESFTYELNSFSDITEAEKRMRWARPMVEKCSRDNEKSN
ncbi:crustapain-like [Stomoxys calcitrans]|uniref:Cathepsin propeptide inhibitor domain-containing protein n=1 Tax=Stomoxys calcitrans TaxID=35570 RepID=A0A1I8PDU0_STOCA|nr:crustapain-like [Stomoxys calcitrans]